MGNISRATDVWGAWVEGRVGQTLEAFVKARIFDPLGVWTTPRSISTTRQISPASPNPSPIQANWQRDVFDPRVRKQTSRVRAG